VQPLQHRSKQSQHSEFVMRTLALLSPSDMKSALSQIGSLSFFIILTAVSQAVY
jgi:hypothetical protein